ncbi:MAG: paraquat-inducible protein A [Calditrichaeota bacterium]|nr:paraquat-inducible protein A [Calditrichota bacterium]
MFSKNNWIALSLLILSLALLIPGLIEPIITIDISPTLPMLGKTTFYKETRSILGTVELLHKNNNSFVAFLILFFSVMVPFIKAILLLLVLFLKEMKRRNSIFRFVAAIGKWSMADVFVVGVFIAFLSLKTNDAVNAAIHSGFYYFTAYCLVSLASIQFLRVEELSNKKALD